MVERHWHVKLSHQLNRAAGAKREFGRRHLAFEPLEQRVVLDSTVVFNEVMYNPLGDTDDRLEWVELYNQLAVNMDISEWSIEGGIEYQFPDGTIVPGRGYLVVAISPADLEATTDVENVLGPYTGRLSNGGEELRLVNNGGRVMNVLDYRDGGDWPTAPDGSGASLAKRDLRAASEPAENWTTSLQIGGTPGRANFPSEIVPVGTRTPLSLGSSWKSEASGTDLGDAWRQVDYQDDDWDTTRPPVATILITEVGTVSPDFVEIQNVSNKPVDTSGWVVALNHGLNAPINKVHPILWELPEVIGPGEVLYRDDTAWGADIVWASTGPNWAMIIDDQGNVVDFIPWKYSTDDLAALDVVINGFEITIGDAWSGPSFYPSPRPTRTTTIQRKGFSDGNTASDWQVTTASEGTENVDLTTPFTAAGLELTEGRTTTYFRTEFDFSDVPVLTELALDLIIDDGAVFYLNGEEVYRHNMPPGNVTYATPASQNVTDPDFLFGISIPSDSLVQGRNVMAVEVHQASSDVGHGLFGMGLTATVWPPDWRLVETTLALNETAGTDQGEFWVELANFGTKTIQLKGHVIANAAGSEYVLPAQSLAAGHFTTITQSQLGFEVDSGDELFLYAPGRSAVLDGVRVKSSPRARFPDGTGDWMRPVNDANEVVPTPGQANQVNLHDEIVINEIMYHAFPQLATDTQPYAESDEEWIELFNRGSTTIDLSGWELDDAVEYDFPEGTTLAPGEYLVVARDAVALREKYPAISGRIVGNFSGTLANTDDRIALIDENGNPADEVHYYERGPWPEYADGGGSSLELRDPDADNSRAEAWAASREGDKSEWKTFTIRKVCSEPLQISTVYPEFIFGLLDSGEFLIDDISVIRDPDGARTQLIQNGNFQIYSVGFPPTPNQWRPIGTHTGTVVADPANPANKVLHVVADGPQQHVHDHVETTLGSSIVDGREYEISFKAKWLGGNSQLNNRLYFSRMGNTVQLDVPEQNGTPGARNSTFATNVGPTYSQLEQDPVLPASDEPVTISVRAEDPDGVDSLVLKWRRDGASWSTAPMTVDAEGFYKATIPAHPSRSIIQFYVQGTDDLGATSTFPAAGINSRALYQVDEGAGTSYPIDTMRIVLTSADYGSLYSSVNMMSNNYVRGTLIYEGRFGDDVIQEAYHDVEIRQVGSRFLRPRSGYKIRLHPDNKFNGVHGSIRFDMSGGGPREIYMKQMVNRAAGSSVSLYDDIAYLIHRHPSEGNRTVLFQMARYEDVFLNEQFQDGSDGTLWELDDITFPTNPNSQNYKTGTGTSPQDIRYRGQDPEAYRGHLLIKNNRTEDAYEKIVELARAINYSGQQLYEATNEVMDVDLWMRHYATQAFLGNWDTYGFRRPKNLRIYLRPEDGKLIPLYWDADLANLSDSLIWNGGASRLDEIRDIPQNLRLFWGHMLDLVDRSFNQQYMAYWIPYYNSMGAGINKSASQVGSRASSAISQARSAIPQVAFRITTNGGNGFSVNDIGATLRGDGWIDIRQIRIAGSEEPLDVTWTDQNSWQLRVPLAPGANQVRLEAVNFRGQVIASDTITITSTMVDRPLQDFLRISEIMYDPADPTPEERDAGFTSTSGFEFIELMNTSDTFTLNLSGVAFDAGIATAADALDGVTLAPGGRTVLVRDPAAFAFRYGSQIDVAATYTGKLDNNGEQIRLVDPFGQTILDFEYDTGGSWPGRAGGKGASLELIEDNLDWIEANAVAGDFGNSAFWQSSAAYLGTPGAAPEDPVGIVINEVLTHTDLPRVDAIELYNPTDQAVDIAGWYLSDSWGWPWDDDPGRFYGKFKIPVLDLGGPGKTLLGPDEYIVFDEHDFNATGLDADPYNDDPHDFALDGAEGEDVWLMKADAAGNITHFVDHVEFPAAANGVSFGRWPSSADTFEFFPMTELTLGGPNSGPRFGPLVISEVQYYPGIFHEDFNLGDVDRFHEVSGNWSTTSDGRYRATPAVTDGDAVSIIDVNDVLQEDYVLETDLNMTAAAGGYRSNAVVVFDYRSPADFKFAGAFADQNRWVIGRRTAGGWQVDASLAQVIEPGRNYDVELRVDGSTATLSVESDEAVFHDFGETLHDGALGLGTYDAVASFGMMSVEPPAESDLEFIEICNPTSEPVNLAQWLTNPHDDQLQYFADFRLRQGIGMEFDENTIIDAQSVLVVLPFDPHRPENELRTAAFREFYGLGPDVPLAGGYGGNLGNGGERVRLMRPDSPPINRIEFVPHYIEDEVHYDDFAPWPQAADGNGLSLHRLGTDLWGDDPANWTAAAPSPGTSPLVAVPEVVGRHVFYNNSSYDGNSADANTNDDLAIASDKTPLLPGQVATFENYTSYYRGINGVFVDIVDPAGMISVDDFRFHVGNHDDPSGWAKAPPPTMFTVREGAGVGGSDRATFVWDDFAIQNQWLQVTVLADNLGLAHDDVFYFGNAVAEVGNDPGDAQVNTIDLLLARNNPRSFLEPAEIDFPYDHNRDGRVNTTDVLLARNNQTSFLDALRLIDLSDLQPAAAEQPVAASPGQDPAPAAMPREALPIQLAWLGDFDNDPDDRPSEKRGGVEEAVDRLLAMYGL